MAGAVSRGPNTLIVAHGGLWVAANQYVTITPPLMRMPNALPLKIVPNGKQWAQQVLQAD